MRVLIVAPVPAPALNPILYVVEFVQSTPIVDDAFVTAVGFVMVPKFKVNRATGCDCGCDR
jgi:hypothetical protein